MKPIMHPNAHHFKKYFDISIQVHVYGFNLFTAQQIIPPCSMPGPVNLAIVIDETSMDRFETSRNYAQRVIDSLEVENQISSGSVRVTLVSSSMGVKVNDSSSV